MGTVRYRMDCSVYAAVDKIISKDDLETITELVDQQTIDEKTAELASRKGVTAVVEKYLKDGNDANRILDSSESGVNVKTCLLANGINGGHMDIVKVVLENGGCKSIQFEDRYLRTCMQKALIDENDEVVELLVEYGDWMDKLTVAVYRGDVERVNNLLEEKPEK